MSGTAYELPAYTGPGSPQSPVPAPDEGTAPPATPPTAGGAVLLQRGRYALSAMPDGTWVITRASPLCDRCASCGCGDPDVLPAIPQVMVGYLTMTPDERARVSPLAMVRKLFGSFGMSPPGGALGHDDE